MSRPVGKRAVAFVERELRDAEAAARSCLNRGGARPSFWYRSLHRRFSTRAQRLREVLKHLRHQRARA